MAAGTVNLRDISTADDATVAKGVILRSAAPIYFTDAGIRHLEAELDVKRVLDIRGKNEIGEKPKATALLSRECLLIPSFSDSPEGGLMSLFFPKPAPVVDNSRWYHVDLLGEAMYRCIGEKAGYAKRLWWTTAFACGWKEYVLREAIEVLGFTQGGLANLYSLILRDTKKEMKEVFELIASDIESRNLPVLIHCSAGKDRTGVVVALLLKLAGVSDEKVVADYALSGGELERLSYPHLGDGMISKIMPKDYLCESPPPAMESVIAEVARFGGAETYLLHHCGVREEALAAIKMGLCRNA